MDFYVMTLFPDMITGTLNTSITGRAMENGLISVHAIDIRDYTENKHRRVDDYPYGGGAGMVMQAQPVVDCYHAVEEQISARRTERQSENKEFRDNSNQKKTRVVYLTPQGSVFNQKMAEELAREEELVFLCGHYEGIDERALEMIVTDYVSIGDYVLTGGEMPSMIMIDAISRLVPGVLNNEDSAEFESFQDGLLEYPQYTRPEEYAGRRVPDVLLSGHHANIEKWRREQSIKRTLERRPDLLATAELTTKERRRLAEVKFSATPIQGEEAKEQAFHIYQTNHSYFEMFYGKEPTLQDVVEDQAALPPGLDLDKKHYELYFDEEGCFGLVDWYVGYLEKNICLIGLFMIDGLRHREGLGKRLYQQLEWQALDAGCKKMRIGVLDGNDSAMVFWLACGFKEVETKNISGHITHVMVKKIKK